jgi:hypothetical protein
VNCIRTNNVRMDRMVMDNPVILSRKKAEENRGRRSGSERSEKPDTEEQNIVVGRRPRLPTPCWRTGRYANHQNNVMLCRIFRSDT